jgi:ABC-type sugar transport system substrate-binding protein
MMGHGSIRRYRRSFTVALVLGLLSATCWSGVSTATERGSSTSGTARSSTSHMTIGVLLLEGDTYFTSFAKEFKALVGSKGTVLIDNFNQSASTEAADVDELVARHVNAIVTGPLSADSVPEYAKAAKAGIPVICYDTCLSTSADNTYVKGYVLSDQAGMGRDTGKFAVSYIKAHIHGTLHIGTLGCDVLVICQQREAAFLSQLRGAGLKYIIDGNEEAYVVDAAVPAATQLLIAHPDINVLYAENDGGTQGEITAVEAEHDVGKVAIFGEDISAPIAKALLTPGSPLLCSTGQSGTATGEVTYKVLQEVLQGRKIVPFLQVVPVVFYDHNTVAALRAWQKGHGA